MLKGVWKLVACLLLSRIREAQERAEELEGGLREWAAKAQLHQEWHEEKDARVASEFNTYI